MPRQHLAGDVFPLRLVSAGEIDLDVVGEVEQGLLVFGLVEEFGERQRMTPAHHEPARGEYVFVRLTGLEEFDDHALPGQPCREVARQLRR